MLLNIQLVRIDGNKILSFNSNFIFFFFFIKLFARKIWNFFCSGGKYTSEQKYCSHLFDSVSFSLIRHKKCRFCRSLQTPTRMKNERMSFFLRVNFIFISFRNVATGSIENESKFIWNFRFSSRHNLNTKWCQNGRE